MEPMNLYLVDECSFIAAYNEEEALKIYAKEYGEPDDEADIRLIDREHIKDIKIYDAEGMEEEGLEEVPMINLYASFLEVEKDGVPSVLIEVEA